MAQESPGQTLEPTALVHEAYLRLVASGDGSAAREVRWDSRGHFFAAAAEAMRRIQHSMALPVRNLLQGDLLRVDSEARRLDRRLALVAPGSTFSGQPPPGPVNIHSKMFLRGPTSCQMAACLMEAKTQRPAPPEPPRLRTWNSRGRSHWASVPSGDGAGDGGGEEGGDGEGE